jgi:hypothetical protein
VPEIKRLILTASAIVLALAATPAFADPWARPGDLALRHDIQLLADAGLIKSPVNAWPIPWATIAHDLGASEGLEGLTPAVLGARARVTQRLATVRGLRGLQPNAKLSARTDSFWTRNFEDTPREEGEARVGLSWFGDRFAARAQVSFVPDPLPGDQEWRGDGSYLAAVIGNHIVHAGALDRWWGPSHTDTLILSSNARPVPGIGIERNVAKPFESKWLSWLGPWTYSYYWGFLESNREVPDARLMAFRFGFRPLNDLEIGLSRTAQWCGQGRPCDFDTVVDLVLGNDNVGDSGITEENEPGNQLAAIDFRWQSPFTDGPWAIYAQATAEDEAGGLPSRYFGQFGGETWGTLDTRWFSGQWRAHLEYTNTAIDFWTSEPAFGVAYNHGVYKTGYRFEGRALGAGVDGDSEVLSVGLMLSDARERTWNGLLRYGTINEEGDRYRPQGALTRSRRRNWKIFGAQLSHRRPIQYGSLKLGTLSIGLGVQYADNQVTGDSETDVQAFLQWAWDYAGL